MMGYFSAGAVGLELLGLMQFVESLVSESLVLKPWDPWEPCRRI